MSIAKEPNPIVVEIRNQGIKAKVTTEGDRLDEVLTGILGALISVGYSERNINDCIVEKAYQIEREEK